MNKSRRVKVFVAAVAAAAAIVTVLTLRGYWAPTVQSAAESWPGLIALVAVAVAAEYAGVRFSAGRASLSAGLIPIVAGVPLFGPGVAVLATAVAEALAKTLLRNPPIKVAFNTAQLTLAIAAGSVVYVSLGGPVSSHEFTLKATLLPFTALVIVYVLVNSSLVSVVLALDTDRSVLDVWRELSGVAFTNDVASSSIALFVVYAFSELGLAGLLVVLLPLLFVHHSYALYMSLQRQNREILELLVKTIEAKDPYTSGHSQRVAWLSKKIAEALGRPKREIDAIETAALLHDIGKVDFAYSAFIAKPDSLTDEERDIIRSHPERGAALLASISSLNATVLEGVKYHHEHWNGEGYPTGLSGTDIPFCARVIMIADTIDAMLSHRPYRKALRPGDVREELERYAGRQFEPAIVKLLVRTELIEEAARRAQAERTGEAGVRSTAIEQGPLRALERLSSSVS